MTNPRVDGTAVRKLRSALNISGADLCRRVASNGPPLSPSHLSQIESGLKQPSASVARAIADALGVELSSLTSGPIRRVVLAIEFGDAA